jgi:sec-independent protein translocase protein TatA
MFAILPGINPMEMMVFGIIALLLFGKRLPEVARSLGKGITEFKRGIKGVEDEFRGGGNSRYESQPRRRPEPMDDDRPELAAPRFEPPTSEPTAAGESKEA